MQFLRRGLCLGLMVLVAESASLGPASGQSTGSETPSPQADATNVGDRRAADAAFTQAIRAILDSCQTQQWQRERALTLAAYIERDPGRQYLFLPGESGDRWQGESFADCDSEWIRQMRSATVTYGASLYKVAKATAESGRGANAYQILHEVLHWDPAHAEARRVLGHGRDGENWKVASDRMRFERGTKPHETMRWPAGSYWQVYTDYFDIASTADEATTRSLAEILQRCQWVWRQVFFDYWGNAGMLKNWMAGTSRFQPPQRRHKVILFADRDQYVDSLAPLVPGVEVSTGYYHDRMQTSFFFASDDGGIIDTWRHELTHQLFQESIRARTGVFDDHSLWLGEGIAMYMESLRDFGSFATLGGWDASRLQYGRMRRSREGFAVPWADLARFSLSEFQRHPEIRQLYSQAAGQCHYLMVGEGGARRGATIELLSALYRGRVQADAVQRILGCSFTELDSGYQKFLPPPPDCLAHWLIAPTVLGELSLAEAQLGDADWKALAECVNLQWLDLSGLPLSRDNLRSLAGLQRLEQLYLNRCEIESGALEALLALPQLKLLDVRGIHGAASLPAELQALSGKRPDLQIQRDHPSD